MYYPVLEISLKDGLWLTLTKKAYKSVICPEIQAYILNVYLYCVAFTWNIAFKLKVKHFLNF